MRPNSMLVDRPWCQRSPREHFVTAGMLLAIAACSSEDADRSSTKTPIGEATSELTLLSTMTDWSNTVTTAVWVCEWSAPASHNHAMCIVPSDYVLVGGGGEIQAPDAAAGGSGGGPGGIEPQTNTGAMLTASYPNVGLTTWNVDSKDHIVAFPHKLRAYAIGLKLSGLTAAQLRDQISIIPSMSQTAAHPTTTSTIGSGLILIGGGAIADYSGAGQLLTESRPSAADAWTASSKDHMLPDPGTVQSIALGLRQCPTGYTGGCLKGIDVSRTANASQGIQFGSVTFPVSGPFALTAMGGLSTYASAGRLLTDQIPVANASPSGFVKIWTKDHLSNDTGTIESHALGLEKQCPTSGASGCI